MTPNKIPFVLDDRLARDLKNLYLRTDLGLLDCLGDVAGIGGYEEALRLSVPCLSGRFRMLNIDAIIAAKKATGRERDHQALILLTAIKEKTSAT
jgi:hypothetical protein